MTRAENRFGSRGKRSAPDLARLMGGVFLRVVVRHPRLALEAARLVVAVSPPGWFRKAPFLPRPDPEYRRWRVMTAYGQTDAAMSVEEAKEFLEWRRSLRRR